DGGERRRRCPICDQTLGNITPQHLALHGVALREGYLRFPELGFTKRGSAAHQAEPRRPLEHREGAIRSSTRPPYPSSPEARGGEALTQRHRITRVRAPPRQPGAPSAPPRRTGG